MQGFATPSDGMSAGVCSLCNKNIGDTEAIRVAEALEKNTSVTEVECVAHRPARHPFQRTQPYRTVVRIVDSLRVLRCFLTVRCGGFQSP